MTRYIGKYGGRDRERALSVADHPWGPSTGAFASGRIPDQQKFFGVPVC